MWKFGSVAGHCGAYRSRNKVQSAQISIQEVEGPRWKTTQKKRTIENTHTHTCVCLYIYMLLHSVHYLHAVKQNPQTFGHCTMELQPPSKLYNNINLFINLVIYFKKT